MGCFWCVNDFWYFYKKIMDEKQEIELLDKLLGILANSPNKEFSYWEVKDQIDIGARDAMYLMEALEYDGFAKLRIASSKDGELWYIRLNLKGEQFYRGKGGYANAGSQETEGLKEKIRDLVGEGEPLKALDLILSQDFRYNDEILNEARTYKGQLNIIMKKEIMGTIRPDDAIVQTNRIITGVLELAKKIERIG